MEIINRNYQINETDDFKLNVAPLLSHHTEAIPIYHPTENYIIGWKIQSRYE